MKKILTIAGSDSGGGAGIQADLKTITVLGGYGMSVITALTAQNTQGVRGVLEASPEFIKLQMDTVLSDIGADAAKTGMLASSEIVRTVAQGVRDHNIKTLVVDPVMVAASGDPLLAEEAVDSVKTDLLPLAHTVTPNLSEASILCGFNVDSPGTMKKAAQTIHTMGPRHVLIKGGHLEGTAMDLFYDGIEFTTFESPRIDTVHTHGTGCTLSAALATFLGQGFVPWTPCRKPSVLSRALLPEV
jgi:hydroxymethylpyrimidine/phosphomethylpyrimidine kinase